jgi:hypothetical protein
MTDRDRLVQREILLLVAEANEILSLVDTDVWLAVGLVSVAVW